MSNRRQLALTTVADDRVPLGLPDPVTVWGVPLAPLSFGETLSAIASLIARGQPSYFITANLNYVMLCDRDSRLDDVNKRAAFLVADGMPLVWATRFGRRRLPERVTGSDLIYALAELASWKGYRVFFLGGAEGIAARASQLLAERYPGLTVAGIESPPFRPLSDEGHRQLIARIRAARADILLVAFGQPKGELWLAEHCAELGVSACVQLGASFDFVAGNITRAPRWVGRVGLEWAYRLACDPRRLGPRYWQNARFLMRAILGRLRPRDISPAGRPVP